jgi:hypothetical protein
MADKTLKEQIDQLKKEIPDFLNGCRALGVQFSCTFLFDDGEHHDIATHLNVNDDHHMLDMMTSQTEVWWDCNHSDST